MSATASPPSSRRVIGLVMPGRPATAGEAADMKAYAPPGVEVMFAAPTPPPLMPPITLERVIGLASNPSIEACTSELVAAGVTFVAYACGNASYVRGLTGERDIRARMQAAGAVATTTSAEMLKAMRELGLRRVAVLSPHIEELNQRLVAFLAEARIETVNLRSMGLPGAIEDVDPQTIVDLVGATDVPEAQGLYIACTSLRLAPVLDDMRAAIGKPVLAANQVTVEGLLRMAGMDAGTRLAVRSPAVTPS